MAITDAETDPTTMTLPDGRRLAYAEYGDPEGTPVFAFHGVPGSRVGWALFDGLAADRGVRLIAPERPGFGHSEFQPDRRLLDWPEDVAALAAQLDVEEFGLAAISGGGPHAVACAHAMPERVRGVAVASTVTPPETHGHAPAFKQGLFDATREVPGFSRGLFESVGLLAGSSQPAFRAAILSTAGRPDRELFDEPIGEFLLRDAAEAFRQGGRGPAHDFPMLTEDWGFDPRELEVPVALYHGRNDETVELDLARAFADMLPDCDLYVTDGAHYSTLVRYAGELLDTAAR